jgi:hypothetical protein
VILTFATISVGQHSDQTLEEEAKRLHYLIKLASEEAVLRSVPMAMAVSKHGYQFGFTQEDQFVPFKEDEERLFRKREFPGEMEMELELYGQAVSFDDPEQLPLIYIRSSGEMSEFTMTLNLPDLDTEPYTITGNFLGQVQLLPPGAQTDG